MMLYKLIDTKKNIDKILYWKYPLLFIFFIKLIQFKKNILSIIRWKFKWYNNIEWLKDFYIDKYSFDSSLRKNWISCFARLYNAWEFLEKTVKSHIDLFDEIILVNNNSKDNTEEICLKLKSKYPSKIKFYNYPFEIYKIWTNDYDNVSENSIHSLSYYYNWTLSKTTYKYALKLDDDHICIKEILKPVINKIKTKWLKNNFLQIPLLNIYRINWHLKYSYNSLKSSFAWLFWDFWIFKITKRTYFIKQKRGESLIWLFNMKLNNEIWFLHLKWIKKWMWLLNYWKNVQEKLKLRINHNNFKKLNKQYKTVLKKNWIE